MLFSREQGVRGLCRLAVLVERVGAAHAIVVMFTATHCLLWILQLKVKALVLDLIHNIDVVDQLLAHDTVQLGEWQWQKQLRFYINPKGKCIVRMVDAEVRVLMSK